MGKSLFILLSLVAALHLYLGLQLLPYLVSTNSGFIIGIILLLISFVGMSVGVNPGLVTNNSRLGDLISWFGMLDMGLFSSLLVLTFVREIALDFYEIFASASADLHYYSAALVIGLAILATVIGFINARGAPTVVNVDIPIDNLPDGLSGFTIAQISDIHVGPTIKENYLNNIVNLVNKLDADLVAITGDLVDGSVEQLSRHTQPLAKLASRYGSFFVLGNHEYYSGAVAWANEISRLGVSVLLNRHEVISHNDAKLVIAGITDYSGRHFVADHVSDPARAIAAAPENSIRILLAHQPRSAIEAEKYGYHLQLSGHTHGGQFWPWNFFVRFQQPFTAGLGRINDMWVYTNRGTGYWGPPKRLGKPSEITLLRLVKAG